MQGTTLVATDLVAGYEGRAVITDVNLRLESGVITALVGPNGSGKSTLLRTLARLHPPLGGEVTLDGERVTGRRKLGARALARRLAFLPQSPIVPTGTTVRELVGHGRYPHRGPLRPATATDREAVTAALQASGTGHLAGRSVETLSGGERQRVWIATVLAQHTGVMLLDEPTTYLDLRYQVEVLGLVRRLADEQGISVGVVLHDLNQAAAYADVVVALGAPGTTGTAGATEITGTAGASESCARVVATGSPRQVVSAPVVRQAFGLDVTVISDPVTGCPVCLPYASTPAGPTDRPGSQTLDS